MKHPVFAAVCGAAVVLGSVTCAQAALITFSSRSAFNAAAPGLPVETFEAGLVGAFGTTLCAGPLSSAAGSACFPTGALLPGVTYSSTLDPDIVVLGAGIPVGNASKVLGPNIFFSTLNLTFGSINTAGLDVFAGPGSGNVLISIFNPANLLLGSAIVAAPTGGAFFGVLSDADLIGRINVASQSPSPGELIDNLAFGTTTAPIPEPSSMVLVGLGLVRIFRRRRLPR